MSTLNTIIKDLDSTWFLFRDKIITRDEFLFRMECLIRLHPGHWIEAAEHIRRIRIRHSGIILGYGKAYTVQF